MQRFPEECSLEKVHVCKDILPENRYAKKLTFLDYV